MSSFEPRSVPVRLIGVGVGPGDPELITVKAVRVLREADVVLVPVMDPPLPEQGDGPGRAESTVLAHVGEKPVRRAAFALNERNDPARREQAWDAAADAVCTAFAEGHRTVAFATIGDPNLYSTFAYLAASVRERLPDVLVETVPGIPAMLDLAARSGTVLTEGTESLRLLPLTAGIGALRDALADPETTVVAYKGGRQLPEMLAAVRDAGRLDDAVYGALLGQSGEDVRPAAALAADEAGPYLSALVVPARRTGRGSKL